MPNKPPGPGSPSRATASSPHSAKPAPQRRAEILDAARRLFITKGVQATSVQDILTEVGIAKGTLYYHFSSKEEILTSLITRTTDEIVARARAIAEGPGTAVDKFLAVLASARVDQPERELAEQLHAPGNAEFHVLSIVEMVRHLTPVLTGIVEQGNAEGTFSARRPREMIEILLTGAGMLLDDGIFTGEAQEAPRRATAIVHAAEVLLGCAPGALAPAVPGAGAVAEGGAPGASAAGRAAPEEAQS